MKLYRPSIPVEVRCRVALRQIGEMWPDRVIDEHRCDWTVAPSYRKSHGKLLSSLLVRLAALLGCELSDLRLDHDPPLAARPQRRRGLGRKTYYEPDANDPAHLFYRPHGPEFAGSHLIKTNVRGDRGQFPDRVLIKRERRRQRKAAGKVRPKAKIASGSAANLRNAKRKWPSRKLRSKSSWR